MGFPATTEDGKTVEIVEKGMLGDKQILRAADGAIYTPSPLDPLKLELIQTAEAVQDGIEEVGAEIEEAIEEIVDEATDAIDAAKDLLGDDETDEDLPGIGDEPEPAILPEPTSEDTTSDAGEMLTEEELDALGMDDSHQGPSEEETPPPSYI